MNERLKEAFGVVHAEESLKRDTLAYVRRRMRGRRALPRRLIPALACLMIALGGMGGLYFTPTSVISIDVNPSLELSVNRFDRVVGVEGLNEDGRALAGELSLTHRTYADAVERVLDSPAVASCVAGGRGIPDRGGGGRRAKRPPAGRAGKLHGRTEEHLLLRRPARRGGPGTRVRAVVW